MPEAPRIGLSLDSREFRERLSELQQNVEDPRAIWDDAVDYMTARERKVWATHGGSQHTPWPAAGARSRRGSRTGKAKRRRLRRSHELLVLTGQLRASLTSKVARGAVRRKTRSSFTFGSRVKTANLHQQDRNPGRGRLPRRPVLELDVQDATALRRIVEHAVFGHDSGAGRLPGGRPL